MNAVAIYCPTPLAHGSGYGRQASASLKEQLGLATNNAYDPEVSPEVDAASVVDRMALEAYWSYVLAKDCAVPLNTARGVVEDDGAEEAPIPFLAAI